MKSLLLPAIAFTGVLLLGSLLPVFGQQPPPKVKVGDKAPAVEGKDPNGKTWKLADQLKHKTVLLYFYPKDDKPGCTKEACGFRDSIADLQKAGVEVVGVSFDSPESHQKFISNHNLNFTLLADTDGKIADEYGVRMPNKQMARRVSFLIGRDGKVTHVTDSGNADVHLTEMKAAAEKAGKPGKEGGG